jgi:calcineurin-like phosphoesterase family protein
MNRKFIANSRREFLKTSSITFFSLALPESVLSLFSTTQQLVSFGLITDLHVDIIHDAEYRFKTFLQEMKENRVDALFQLGDFAIPKAENHQVIEAFNRAHPKAYHVLGNHDMDGGFSREEVVKAYGMPGKYYSTEVNGIQILVLDGNDTGSPAYTSGYPSYIGSEQQAWLREKLTKADQPVLIVSHQPIAGIYTIDNAKEIQALLSEFSEKILLAINGHAHVDQLVNVDGVNYLHLNSASYYWVGEKLSHLSLPEEIHDKYPSLKFTCPYSEPLFGVLTIDPKEKKMTLKGKKTQWIGPSPLDLGYAIVAPELQKLHVQPRISDREM